MDNNPQSKLLEEDIMIEINKDFLFDENISETEVCIIFLHINISYLLYI